MKIKGLRLVSFILLLILVISLTGCSNEAANEVDGDAAKGSSNKTINITELQIGDRVMDASWEWEFRTEWAYMPKEGDITSPIVWIVVEKDHYNTPGITLLSENLIGYLPFDTSMLESGLVAGHNHWGDSGTGNAQFGLRPWLNSNGIHEGEGFYTAFSNDFKSIVLDTEVPNKEYEQGTDYTTTDKVFIPSSTELGDTEHTDTYEIGSVFTYFEGADDELRMAMIKGDLWEERNYWLRSPNTQGYRPVGSVYERGFFVNDFADFNSIGVRPVVNISSSTKVSAEPDENGVYIIKFN